MYLYYSDNVWRRRCSQQTIRLISKHINSIMTNVQVISKSLHNGVVEN